MGMCVQRIAFHERDASRADQLEALHMLGCTGPRESLSAQQRSVIFSCQRLRCTEAQSAARLHHINAANAKLQKQLNHSHEPLCFVSTGLMAEKE